MYKQGMGALKGAGRMTGLRALYGPLHIERYFLLTCDGPQGPDVLRVKSNDMGVYQK